MIYSVVVGKVPNKNLRYSILVCRASWTLYTYDVLLNIHKFCCVQFTALWIFLIVVCSGGRWCRHEPSKAYGRVGFVFKTLLLLTANSMYVLSEQECFRIYDYHAVAKITFTQETKKRFCCIFTLHSFSFRYSFVKVRDADEYQTIT